MFIALDLKLLERDDLSSSEKIICALISSYDAFPVNHTLISRITGISRTTVIKNIKNLLDKKIIVVAENHYHSCINLSNRLHYIPTLKRSQDILTNKKNNELEDIRNFFSR